jgi:FkbM family methyltransferase
VSLRRRAPLAVIKLARRAFANTPVQRLPAVGWFYRRTVSLAFGEQEFSTDVRGLRLTVPGGDHVFTAGLAGGFYEAIELDLMERLAAHSRVVLDVGANIGIHTCVAAAHLPEGGLLIGFEPVPGNLAYLRRNLARNGLSERVRIESSAVGEAPGETVIHLDRSSGNHSLASGVVGGNHGSLPVQVITLDGYLAGAGVPGPVDLMKVDVEGYDGYVLRGAAGLLREQRPTLLAEFVPSHLANAGFDSGEFLDIIFDTYEYVYVIDEPRGRLDRGRRDDLNRHARKAVNLNVVAAQQAEHVELIERYRARPVR